MLTVTIIITVKWEKKVEKLKPLVEEGPLWLISELSQKGFKDIWFSLDE